VIVLARILRVSIVARSNCLLYRRLRAKVEELLRRKGNSRS
jgi:hypothetical protein